MVNRPSWQAQLSGQKIWTLIPPPECEHVCKEMQVTMNKGEISKWERMINRTAQLNLSIEMNLTLLHWMPELEMSTSKQQFHCLNIKPLNVSMFSFQLHVLILHINIFSSFSCSGHQPMVSLHKGYSDWRTEHHNWSRIRLTELTLVKL